MCHGKGSIGNGLRFRLILVWSLLDFTLCSSAASLSSSFNGFRFSYLWVGSMVCAIQSSVLICLIPRFNFVTHYYISSCVELHKTSIVTELTGWDDWLRGLRWTYVKLWS